MMICRVCGEYANKRYGSVEIPLCETHAKGMKPANQLGQYIKTDFECGTGGGHRVIRSVRGL